MTVVRAVTGTSRILPQGWMLLATEPGQYTRPQELPDSGWLPATVPGTVATAARNWSEDAANVMRTAVASTDYHDWWYRCRLTTAALHDSAVLLRCEGLATIAEVWLGGTKVLDANNMFHEYSVVVGQLLGAGEHELVICFHALSSKLVARLPRPRWRTRLVEHQQLRWFRTTLLGRIPAWSPGPPLVGPWRAVTLEVARFLVVHSAWVDATVDGSDGIVRAALAVELVGGRRIAQTRLRVGAVSAVMDVANDERLLGTVIVPDPPLWWPHTHGPQPLFDVRIDVMLDDTSKAVVNLGSTGFRRVRLADQPERFALRINDTEAFFRGGCWTPLDPAGLVAEPSAYRAALCQLKEAGGNMVRICGPTYYELDEFYTCCDELGIAVWQDFMFANMDYPVHDEDFLASIRGEVRQVLDLLAGHPCVMVLCGNSEIEQQAALLGLPRESWTNSWFSVELPGLCAERAPGVPYWPSSPTGGTFPMSVDSGDSHYQGVGAYLRDLDDPLISGVQFASECLAFANVPEPHHLERYLGCREPGVQEPIWKAGSPRDRRAGWDFDDIRDRYLQRLFEIDPLDLRYHDIDQYLRLARVTSGEVMARVFTDWRSPWSPCTGGLVWFWRDLVPGAGWGIVDTDGCPKAAYYYLRRAWGPCTTWLVDRGMNGLWAVAINDTDRQVKAVLRLTLYPVGSTVPSIFERPVRLKPHDQTKLAVEAVIGGFRDLNHVFRFGPAGHDLVMIELIDLDNGTTLGENLYFPGGLRHCVEEDVGLGVTAEAGAGEIVLTVIARRTARSVRVEINDMIPDDNYFHLAPNRPHQVHLRPVARRVAPTQRSASSLGSVCALNSRVPVIFSVGIDHAS